ncbi:MAG TPA: acyloxyacyl hydrolase [Syntrophobacteria bacterium]|nr:acyloxyacyl hydrolase [Syntrophobacteria bacterium]
MKTGIILFTLLVSLGLTEASFADDKPLISEVWVMGFNSGLPLVSHNRKENSYGLGMELVFSRPEFSLLGGSVRPAVGAEVAMDTKGTSKAFGDLLWEIEKANFFFDVGLGGAVHNGNLHGHDPDEKHYGSRVLFYGQTCLGYSYTAHHRLALFFDHMSNAYLARPNNGLNTIGVMFQYRF